MLRKSDSDENPSSPSLIADHTKQQIASFFGSGKTAPWLWALTEHQITGPAQSIISNLYAKFDRSNTIDSAIAFLDQCSDEVEYQLIQNTLLAVSAESAAAENLGSSTDLSSMISKITDQNDKDILHDPLSSQLADVEARLIVAWFYQRPDQMEQLSQTAMRCWVNAIDALLDGDGWIEARFWSLMRPLLACWTRCSMLASLLKLELPNKSRLQVEWMVRQAIRSSGFKGAMLLDEAGKGQGLKKFWSAVLDQFGDKEDRIAASQALTLEARETSLSLLDEPEISGYSEWAGTALLRQSWQSNASKIAVLFHDQQLQIEIETKHQLVTRLGLAEIRLGGQPLNVLSEFEVTCWHTDDDIDYLELEYETEKQVRVQRQIMLAREDNFAVIADSVKSPEPAKLSYSCSFPLGNKLSTLRESETNEFYLCDKSIRSLILPIDSPEWQVEKSNCLCKIENHYWTFEKSLTGQYLFAPVFIDLNARRSKKPRTWRKLTVAQQLQIINDDSACAYRIQIGKEQWLLYRSLGPKAGRTFLGQNKNCEFYLGRFDQYGETDELISIE